jgi:prepilin-type N-terminal cleavage/methylation domain-containing protein
MSMPRRRERAFTLLELLVTVALVAALAVFVLRGSAGAGTAAALRSGQTAIANLFVVARARAMAGGDSARVLFHVDPTSAPAPQRYLRCCVVQVGEAGKWETVTEIFLPRGVYFVPGNFPALPGGLFSPEAWVRDDGVSALRSTALRADRIVSEAIGSTIVEQWASVTIADTGNTSQSGDLVLVSGEPRPIIANESPVRLTNPASARGLTLSTYGLAALVDDRASF